MPISIYDNPTAKKLVPPEGVAAPAKTAVPPSLPAAAPVSAAPARPNAPDGNYGRPAGVGAGALSALTQGPAKAVPVAPALNVGNLVGRGVGAGLDLAQGASRVMTEAGAGALRNAQNVGVGVVNFAKDVGSGITGNAPSYMPQVKPYDTRAAFPMLYQDRETLLGGGSKAAAAPAQSKPAATPTPENRSGPVSRNAQKPAEKAPAKAADKTPPPPAQTAAEPAKAPLKPGDLNTFTRGNQVIPLSDIQGVNGAAPAAAPAYSAAPALSLAPKQAAAIPVVGGAAQSGGYSGTQFLDNRSQQSEVMRRFSNALSGARTRADKEAIGQVFATIIGGGIQAENQQAAAGAAGANQIANTLQGAYANSQRGREADAASIAAAGTKPPDAPQLLTGQDGTAQMFNGAPQLTPVTSDGKPFSPRQQPDSKVQAAQQTAYSKAYTEILQSLLPVGQTPTPEQFAAADAQARQGAAGAVAGGTPSQGLIAKDANGNVQRFNPNTGEWE